MFDISQYPQADAVRRAAQLSQDEYTRLYKESIEHPSAFWAERGHALSRLDDALANRPAL